MSTADEIQRDLPFELPLSAADARRALFGGTGTVLVWDLLQGRAAPPFSAVVGCMLEPGGSVGAHAQPRDPEIVIGVFGAGTAQVNGVDAPLRAGLVVHVPHGATLALRNDSAGEPLVYVIVKAHVTGT